MPDLVPPVRVIARATVLSRELDDELVLYNPATDGITHLDAIATHVWHEFTNAVDVATVVDRLANRFEADPATVSADVHKLLTELLEADLVERLT